jgi:hypothetical protein
MTLSIADVVITEREVIVPLDCPHCEADLTTPGEDGEIKLLIRTLDDVNEHGAIEMDDGLSEPNLTYYEAEGSDTVCYMDLICDACHKSVLTDPGTLRSIRPDRVVTT